VAKRGAILLALLALLVAGCGIPDSGDPHVVRQILPGDGDLPDQSNARSVPPVPQPRGTPEQSVDGFLVAVGSAPEKSYQAARNYLVAPLAWKPSGPVRIFNRTQVSSVGRPELGRVQILGTQVGLVNEDGTYTPKIAPINLTVQLSHDGGVWRIVNPPTGVLFRSDFFVQSYVPSTLYFLDPTGQRLVPDVRYLDTSDSVSDRWTTAIRLLLDGPSAVLRTAVRTGIPASTRLRGNVVQDNQDIVVDVSSDAALAPPTLAPGMVAQFLWTMKSVAGRAGSDVRLMIDGREVTSLGTSNIPVSKILTQYDPTVSTAGLSPFRIVNGVVQPMPPKNQEAPSAVSAATNVLSVAMSVDQSAVAMVRPAAGDQEGLFVGPSAGPLQAQLIAAKISAPTWEPDHSGVLVAVDGTRFSYVPMGRSPITVSAPGLSEALGKKGRLTAVRLAPDGVHLALVISDGTSGQVLTGVLQASPTVPAVTNLLVVSDRLTGASDVAWIGDNQLITIGRDAHGQLVQNEMSADGSGDPQIVAADGLRDLPTQLAAIPRGGVYAAAGGHVYQQYRTSWGPPDNPKNPPVPGSGVFYPS
jgi:hypothetical protein